MGSQKFNTSPGGIIFGGKKNWIDYNRGKITKEEFKQKKDMTPAKKSPLQTKEYRDELQMDRSLIVDKSRFGFLDSS